MDTLSHAAWGSTIIRNGRLVGWAALSGTLPDLITFFYGILKLRQNYFKRLEEMGRGENPDKGYFMVYRLSHSLVPISAITPFGSQHKVEVIMDKALSKMRDGIFTAGSFTESLRLKVKDFLKVENVQTGDVGKKK